jgi:ABC-type transport system involved in multi-copper enzyme maturation permease subunit
MRQHLRVIFSIAYVTLREIVRDKVLYNVVVLAILLFGAGYLASRITFVRQERLLLDFGATAMVVANLLMAAVLGAALLNREIERRTLHLALSRPIYRLQIIFGKFLGLSAVLLANTLITGGVLYVLLTWVAPQPSLFLDSFLQMVALNFLQAALIAGVAIFFSTFTTASLSATLAIGVFLIGTNVGQLEIMAARSLTFWGKFIPRTLALIFPNLNHFSYGSQLAYGLVASTHFMAIAVLYSVCYTLTFLCLGGFLIELREI